MRKSVCVCQLRNHLIYVYLTRKERFFTKKTAESQQSMSTIASAIIMAFHKNCCSGHNYKNKPTVQVLKR